MFVGMQCAWPIDRLATTQLGMRGLSSVHRHIVHRHIVHRHIVHRYIVHRHSVHRRSVHRRSVHRHSLHIARSGKALVCLVIIDRQALVKLSQHVPHLFFN